MRIALFSHFYFPTINGVVTSMENLRLGLTQLGHDVYIVAPRSRKYTYPPEVKIINFPSINFQTKGFFLPIPLTFSPKIFKRFKELNFDIIHTQHPFYIGESAHFYAKRFKAPLVYTFHTQYDQYALSYLPFLPKKTTVKAVNKYIEDFTSRCDGVIFPTKEIKNKYLPRLKSKYAIIPSGINIERFKNKPEITRKSLGIKPEKIILLTAGRVAKEKNIEFLIHAFQKVQKENKQVVFLIIGDGPAKKELEKLVEQKGLSQKIIFTGEVPYQRIADYYQLADIFVYSCLTDVQPQTIVEAAVAQLLIIAIDSPDRKYILRNNKNSILTPNDVQKFAQEVLKSIQNPKRRSSLGQNAARTVGKFSCLKTAQQVAKFYQQTIKSYH